MNLPNEMPEGCNFYSVAIMAKDRTKAILDSFAVAGWSVTTTPEATKLATEWARLTAKTHEHFVLSGWIDSVDTHTGEILGILQQSKLQIESQWIRGDGHLWREIPFDERMIDRLPDHIKSEFRKDLRRSRSKLRPWWKVW